MSASAPGTRSAPPIPCTARPAMSHEMDGANPQAIEATVKMEIPQA